MSTISASTTSTTAFKITTDTTGALVFQTGASPTTAMTLGSDQSVTFAGTPTYSGGTANGVAYLNGSKVLTTGTALVFTGTNLGVANTSPSYSLSVGTPGTTVDSYIQIASTTTGTGNLFFGDTTGTGTGSYSGYVQYLHTSDALCFGTAATERIRIDSSGNVGIGTSSPTSYGTSKLAVVGGQMGLSGASSAYFYLYTGTTARGLFYADTGRVQVEALSSLPLVFWTGSAERMRVNAGAPVLCLAGGNTSATGTGIAFPATQSDSSDANTLDDYEEGTYTPTITVSSGTPTYSYQQGYYTKIGRQVFGGGIIGITNNNTLTGEFRVTLPFTIASGVYGYTGGFVSDGSGFTWPVTQGGNSFYTVYLQAQQGVANLSFVGVGTAAAQVNYTSGGIGTSWYFRFSFSIYV
jgi:hypothetical protein